MLPGSFTFVLVLSGLSRGIGLRLCRGSIVRFSGPFAVFPAFRPILSFVIGRHQRIVYNRARAFLPFDKRILGWNLGRPCGRFGRIKFWLRFRYCCRNRTCLRYWLWYRRLRRHRVLRKCPSNPQKHCKYACKVFHGSFWFSEQKLPIQWAFLALKAFQKRAADLCLQRHFLRCISNGPSTKCVAIYPKWAINH